MINYPVDQNSLMQGHQGVSQPEHLTEKSTREDQTSKSLDFCRIQNHFSSGPPLVHSRLHAPVQLWLAAEFVEEFQF